MIEPNNELYASVLEVRNKELDVLWMRFNIHFLVNGGFLIAVLSASSESVLRSAGKIPYWFGLIIAILWLLSEISGRFSLHYRDGKIRVFEDTFWTGTEMKNFRLFESKTPFCLRLQMIVSIFLILIIIAAWILLIAGVVGHDFLTSTK